MRGRNAFAVLILAACGGEGGADGNSLLDFVPSEAGFVTFMRSGGRLGQDHQYSANRFSDSGSRSLCQCLVSMAQGS